MKILHINKYDTLGGAARATYNIHKGLRRKGVDSKILVSRKDTTDPNVVLERYSESRYYRILRGKISKLPFLFYKHRLQFLSKSFAYLPNPNLIGTVRKMNPDIVHLHSITGGFLSTKDISQLSDYKIVWTLHDMWPFTGLCHYAMNCNKFEKNCGKCPQLKSDNPNDISSIQFKIKLKSYSNLDINIVAISKWLEEKAKSSNLFGKFPIRTIPNSLDITKFKPTSSKSNLFKRYNIPKNIPIILTGGRLSDPLKGKLFIEEIVKVSYKINKNYCLVNFGDAKIQSRHEYAKIINIGYIRDFNDLIDLLIYSDITLFPSIQEGFGRLIFESMASGTPVVAFNTTGPKGIIKHKKDGYLAKLLDLNDLVNGINWVLEKTQEEYHFISEEAKSNVKRFDNDVITNQYIKLYKEIIE